MSERNRIVLGINGGALGGHLGGWRHPDSFPTTAMRLERMIEIAKTAESGKLDLMFLADGNACGRWTSRRSSRPTAPPTGRPCSSR